MQGFNILLAILAISFIYVFLTSLEVVILKISKRVDAKKYLWYPISANVLSLIITVGAVFLTVVLGALGFLYALDKRHGTGEIYLYLAVFTLVLVPILIFVIRTILFLLFGLGRFPIALLYSFLTAVVVVVLSTAVFLVLWSIYLNFTM